MKNVLILGATGFIGQNLAEKLKRTVNVIGYDQFLAEVDYPIIEGNFSEEQNFEQILVDNKIDTLYHLISTTVPKEDTSDICQEVTSNVIPTLRLLEAMRCCRVSNLIFASSGGTVYGEGFGAHTTQDKCSPMCGYGMQKLVIEDYLQFYNRRYGMNCKIARISNPYGVPSKRPRGQGIIPIFMGKLLYGDSITVFGDTLRDYIHIDDVVDALIKLGSYAGNIDIFNIGTGIPVSISEIIDQIEKTAGQTFPIIIRQSIRACDVCENVLDISETVRELDWSPKIDLASGILRTWEEIKIRLY